jgi:hypothetical protein
MKALITLSLIILLVATACVPGSRTENVVASKYRPYTVVLQPKNTPGNQELEVKSGPQGYGKGGKKNGFVGFDSGEYGTITFTLKGEEAGDQCSPKGSANWVITRIAFSDSGNTTTEKGDNFNAEQDDWLVNAFPGVDKDTGVLYEEDKEDGISSVAIFDWNDHPAAWGVKTAYYEVTATECASGDEVKTDPGIVNKGK